MGKKSGVQLISCPNFVPLTNQTTGQGYKPEVCEVVDFVESPHRRASGLADHLRHVQSRGPGHDHHRCEAAGKAWRQVGEFCGVQLIAHCTPQTKMDQNA